MDQREQHVPTLSPAWLFLAGLLLFSLNHGLSAQEAPAKAEKEPEKPRKLEIAPAEAPKAADPSADPKADDHLPGRMITIQGAIDSGTANRVLNAARAAVRDGAEVVIFDIQAGSSKFGPCYDLARSISELGGKVKRTVAFVSKPLTGHAVLVALACDEIVMAEKAGIGDVYRDLPSGGTAIEENAYQEVARAKGHGAWIPLAMVNKNLRLLEVQTPTGKQFLPSDKLDEFSKEARVLKTDVVKEAGDRLYLNAESAKKYGLIHRTAETRREVAAAYDLSEKIAAQDDLHDEAIHAVRLRLEGPINGRMLQYVRRRLEQARRAGNNLIFVEIDSTGGSESAADGIAHDLRGWPGRKVAWIPAKALGAAALIPFGCDELVIAPNATIGGFELKDGSPEEYGRIADNAVEMANGSKYPPTIVRGMIDRTVSIIQVRDKMNPKRTDFKTGAEMERPDVQAQWENVRRGPVKEPNIPWRVVGLEAVSFDLAVAQAATVDELCSIFDIGDKIQVLQASWVDALVDGLTSTGGTVFLLVVAGVCLYIEFQMPGFGIAGLLSALCFVLFFWSRYLSDTAGSLEIVMFVTGLVLLAVEIFVLPGFGITGLAGIILLVGSLVLAGQSFTVPRTDAETWEFFSNIATLVSVLIVVMAIVGSIARYFPQMPYFSRMVLAPPADGFEEGEDEEPEDSLAETIHSLVGQVGTAATPLRPAGRMRLGDRFYDVVAIGEFIDPGVEIEVLEVHPNRIIVRQVEA